LVERTITKKIKKKKVETLNKNKNKKMTNIHRSSGLRPFKGDRRGEVGAGVLSGYED
jgi:hypothetical protein